MCLIVLDKAVPRLVCCREPRVNWCGLDNDFRPLIILFGLLDGVFGRIDRHVDRRVDRRIDRHVDRRVDGVDRLREATRE